MRLRPSTGTWIGILHSRARKTPLQQTQLTSTDADYVVKFRTKNGLWLATIEQIATSSIDHGAACRSS